MKKKYEVKKYEDFTDEERERSQQIWVSFLNDYCPTVGDTDCRPCDLGCLCDNCHYDYELQKRYVRYMASEGFPITQDQEDKYIVMDYDDFLDVVRELAKSQGFYSRTLKNIENLQGEELDDFKEHIEEQKFKDSLDVVMYFES